MIPALFSSSSVVSGLFARLDAFVEPGGGFVEGGEIVGLAFPDADDGDDEEDVGGEREEHAAEAAAREATEKFQQQVNCQNRKLQG